MEKSLKSYLGLSAFFIVSIALWWGVIPALISHRSYELPILGIALIVLYFPAAYLYVNKFVTGGSKC